jgi:vitamin B12 transporter
MKGKLVKQRATVLCALMSSTLLLQMPGIVYAAEDGPFSLDEVVITANRVPTEASKTAANVTVITKEQIENGNYASLGDVLRDVNGAIVTSRGFAGSAQAVRLNGDDRVLVMIDGRKVSRPEGIIGGRAGADLSTILSLDNIERIEIVKGGASALYGSDAVGGVINIITRKGTESKTILDMAAGSWGERNYSLSTQGSEDGLSWYITADKKHQDYSEYNMLNPALISGTNKGGTYRWPNSEFDGQGFTVRLDKTIDADRSWTFNLEHWDDQGGQPYSLSTASDAIATHLQNNVAMTYHFDQTEDIPGFVRIFSNYNNQGFYGTYKSRTQGFQYQTGWQLDGKNKLIAGADWEKGTVLDNTVSYGAGSSYLNYKDKSTSNTAVYLQDIYALHDKWTVTPGVRYDHHNKFGGQTSPKVNVNYSADKETDVYVSYNKVFKAPNLDDLYYTDYYQGNPDLKPEKGHVLSAGVNKKVSANTLIKANYFTSKLTNAIHWYPDDPNDQWGSVWKAYNITEEKKHGFEFDINRKFSDKYFADLGYSYIHTEERGDEYGIIRGINSQPNGYRVKLGYGDNQWAVQVSAQGVSGRDTSRFVDSSYWIWNMAVNYQMTKDASLYFNAFNLTNEAYEITSSGTGSARGDYPMAARNFQLGVKYTF